MNRSISSHPPTSHPYPDNTVTICVTDVINDNFCVVCEDGKRVYEHVAAAMLAGKKVRLSFKNGKDMTSAFLAEAFCRLYANFPEAQIENCLSLIDIDPDDAADIECVIQDVKDYLNHPQRFRDAIIEVMGEDSL